MHLLFIILMSMGETLGQNTEDRKKPIRKHRFGPQHSQEVKKVVFVSLDYIFCGVL